MKCDPKQKVERDLWPRLYINLFTIGKCVKYFSTKTILLNTVQKYYHLPVKYRNFVFSLFQEQHRVEFFFDWLNRSSYSSFSIVQVFNSCFVNIFSMCHHKKSSIGVKSDDREVREIDPPISIYWSSHLLFMKNKTLHDVVLEIGRRRSFCMSLEDDSISEHYLEKSSW